MKQNTYLVVLDTNVIVAALRSKSGASYQLLKMIIDNDKRFRMLLSVPVFFEYESVLKRSQQTAFHHLNYADIENILAIIAKRAKRINIPFLWRPQLKDPKDEMILELAINGQADYLVTFNLRDFSIAQPLFETSIISPRDFYLKLK